MAELKKRKKWEEEDDRHPREGERVGPPLHPRLPGKRRRDLGNRCWTHKPVPVGAGCCGAAHGAALG